MYIGGWKKSKRTETKGKAQDISEDNERTSSETAARGTFKKDLALRVNIVHIFSLSHTYTDTRTHTHTYIHTLTVPFKKKKEKRKKKETR